VVATTAGGIPELVVDGECGLLAPVRDDAGLAERVERVLRELGLRARLVEGGRRRVERFSIRRMADEMGSVYEELLGGGQAAATSAS
jgi:glycosyltransferase involved in cell wall biosynthesis